MHHPKRAGYFGDINRAIGVRTMPYGNSMTPAPKPFIGLATSAFRPSAEIVRAVLMRSLTALGNFSKSFLAALIHEMGRESRFIA